MELDLNPVFDTALLQARRKQNLKDVIFKCEKDVISKINEARLTGSSRRVIDGMVNTFVGVYQSLDNMIGNQGLFYQESEPMLSQWNYSLNRASRAISNSLLTPEINDLRKASISRNSGVSQSQLQGSSEYVILRDVFKELMDGVTATEPTGLQWAYFDFFNGLVETSEQVLTRVTSTDLKKTLDQIVIKKDRLDFSVPPPPPARSRAKPIQVKRYNGDKELPTELTPYSQNASSRLEMHVGNYKALKTLKAGCIRTLAYNPKTKRNPFINGGAPFINFFILHGEPGVGKTHLVDGIANWVIESSKVYGEKVMVPDLSSELLTSYMDRKSATFMRYIDIIKEGEMAYFCVIDEFDSLIEKAKGGSDREVQQLIGKMKTAINGNTLGNATYFFLTNYPKKIESAFKQRAKTLYMLGAQSPEEFGTLFYRELGGKGNSKGGNQKGEPCTYLSKSDYLKVGNLFVHYKEKFERLKIEPPVTGRDGNLIASTFIDGDDDSLIANEHVFREGSEKKKSAYIKQLIPKFNYRNVEDEIHQYFKDRMDSNLEHI